MTEPDPKTKAKRPRLPRGVLERVRAREQKRGLLIAFEGPDSAGNRTQRRLFKTWLEHEGHEVVTARPRASRGIRPLLKVRSKLRVLSAEELCLLQAADFRHQLETRILPALWQGKTVVADRFLFTSLARASARGLDLDWLLAAHAPLFWPDIVFYFAVSPETSTTRVASMRAPKYYDAGQDVTSVADPIGELPAVHRPDDPRVRVARPHLPVRHHRRGAAHLRAASTHPALFQEGGRRPWGQWNEEAVSEWLAWSPAAEEVRRGAPAGR